MRRRHAILSSAGSVRECAEVQLLAFRIFQDGGSAEAFDVTSEYMTRYLWMRREERQGGRWRFLSPWLGCSASPTRILWQWRS